MRKLASIQTITKIEPIEDADRIELAHVLGWQCVVNKGQFKEGDLCVYFEIDSFLPIKPEFEFLRKSSYRNTELMGEGFRLRTQRFRGQISQGLLLPITVFAELDSPNIGDDVTEILGVRKFEIPEIANTSGTIIGELPGDIPHTDETRVQAMPELIESFKGFEYYISTKLDGSSHSIGINDTGFHVTGHKAEFKNDGKSGFYNLVNKCGYQEKLEAFIKDSNIKTITIQGELCGPGIQKNRLGLTEPKWFAFNVMVNGKRVCLKDMLEICATLDIPTVPIEEIDNDLTTKYPTVDALLERADGFYDSGSRKEGIVIRPTSPVYCKLIGTDLSMKIVSNKYLIKNGD